MSFRIKVFTYNGYACIRPLDWKIYFGGFKFHAELHVTSSTVLRVNLPFLMI